MSNVYIDVETTGLDPTRHAVWEIAIITDHGEFSWILQLNDDEMSAAEPMALTVGDFYHRYYKAFYEYVQKIRSVPMGMQATEDYSPLEQMRNHRFVARGDRTTLADFLVREIDTSHLIGAVPSFDARFVGDFCRAHYRIPAWHYHLVDIEALAAGKLGWQPPWKSKELYRALGVDPLYFSEHTALGDARMAKAVYEAVFGLEPSYPKAMDSVDEEKDEPEMVEMPTDDPEMEEMPTQEYGSIVREESRSV